MRTWLLAPDGVWTEVTDRLAGCDPDPARWPWQTILDGIAGLDALHCAYTHSLTRADLPTVAGTFGDRWIVNLLWSTLCAGVDSATVMNTTALASEAWLEAVAKWAGRPYPDTPPMAWMDRRARWLIWAHSSSATTPALDGARVVPGAVHPV